MSLVHISTGEIDGEPNQRRGGTSATREVRGGKRW